VEELHARELAGDALVGGCAAARTARGALVGGWDCALGSWPRSAGQRQRGGWEEAASPGEEEKNYSGSGTMLEGNPNPNRGWAIY
jgi:hypothetical protein